MMNRMKPSHPGAILREDILKEMNISITKAAEILKVSRKQISGIVNENVGISAEMALRLEKAFGIEAKFWLDIQSKYDLWKVRNSNAIPNIRRIAS